jgi:hypothetical protein
LLRPEALDETVVHGAEAAGRKHRVQGTGSGERAMGSVESLRMIEKMFSLIERELEWNT